MTAQVITISPALEEKALSFPDQAKSLVIADQPGYERAAELLLGIKDLRNEAEVHHRPVIEAAHASHKAALAALKRVDEPLEQAERLIKPKMLGYLQEQERIRLEAERVAREEAERQQAEALEASIEAAEAEGASVEEVAAIIQQPAAAPVVRVAPAVQQVAGVSAAKVYRAEVYNLRELCKAVAEGKAPEAFVTANMPNLNGMARSTRGSLKIPGVRVVEDSTLRAGRR